MIKINLLNNRLSPTKFCECCGESGDNGRRGYGKRIQCYSLLSGHAGVLCCEKCVKDLHADGYTVRRYFESNLRAYFQSEKAFCHPGDKP